ncbi:PadR family transcriptional regulator [Microbacterium sp. 22303]|uniref:PadR family transcriptional regulator n=1 Tax=Microbacterium sp. 22303 TaxID=3453905 RepID=UPI003F85CD5A
MSLAHAILTALNERPSSGLELARRFDRSIGYFWPATHQQIYRELRDLERDGLIVEVADGGGRGGKRTYAILEEGRDELRRWIAAAEDPKHIKDSLMVRVRASSSLGGDLLPEIRRHREIHARQLAEYEAIEKRDFQGALSEIRRRQYLVLQWGLHLQKARLDWADAAIEQLETLSASRGEGPIAQDPMIHDPKGTS